MTDQKRHFDKIQVSPVAHPNGRRRLHGRIGNDNFRACGWLMPAVKNHRPEQPKSLAVKLLERRLMIS